MREREGDPAPVFVVPEWPAPDGVRAASTTRTAGHSTGVYDSFNLGAHCGDDVGAVAANRGLLRAALDLPGEPCWLEQVHGTTVVDATAPRAARQADAAVTARRGAVCAVLTADCLPVLLCDLDGTCVGAAHAGWRGLAAGVLEATIARMRCDPSRLIAWLGPGIGPHAYEVGPEVRRALEEGVADGSAQAFAPSPRGRWLADLYALARLRLARAGLQSIHGGEHCTHEDGERFYSYRRDGPTGRMATLIWLA